MFNTSNFLGALQSTPCKFSMKALISGVRKVMRNMLPSCTENFPDAAMSDCHYAGHTLPQLKTPNVTGKLQTILQ